MTILIDMGYYGGKGASGTYQKLISLIPPHDTYIETHLGSGAVMKHKRPANQNIGIDLDQDVLATHEYGRHVTLKEMDAVAFLRSFSFTGNEFIYSDPPYLQETRQSSRKHYRFDYNTEQHIDLLNTLKSIPCQVMISGYQSRLYEILLKNWHTAQFATRTRSGSIATEWIWMNYSTPKELHDFSFAGSNFRERERIKRKTNRWLMKLRSLPIIEKQALVQALINESDFDNASMHKYNQLTEIQRQI